MAAEVAELDIPASETEGMEIIEGPQDMALVTNDPILHARFQLELADADMPAGAPSAEDIELFNGARELPTRHRALIMAGTVATSALVTTAAAGSIYESASPSGADVLPRATEDREDQLKGRQIHVVYAVPSDGGNLNSDTDGSINQILANMDNYAENRGMPGMRWRWDLSNGQPDISYFQFKETGAQLAEMSKKEVAFLDHFNAEIKKAGLNNNPQKVYMGIYEPTAPLTSCSNGERWPTVFIGGPAAQDNSTLDYLYRNTGCIAKLTPSITSSLLHIIGFPTKNAPNSDKNGEIIDDIRDVLWKENWKAGWPYQNSMFDPGRDDYLGDDLGIEPKDDLRNVKYVTFPLNVTEYNSENGDVIYLPAGVAVGSGVPDEKIKSDPGNRFTGGTEVTLKAEGEFVKWGGDCAQEQDDTCDLLVNKPHNVTAFFKETIKKTKAIRVEIKKKWGGGVVVGAGVKCPPDCLGSIQQGKELTLTAKPNKISRATWIGGCARKIGNKCIVSYGTTDAPKTATVVFSHK